MDKPAGAQPTQNAARPQPHRGGRSDGAKSDGARSDGNRSDGGKSDHRHRRPRHQAPVARLDDARSRRAAPPPASKRSDESDAAHLPAFLLRPVPVKA